MPHVRKQPHEAEMSPAWYATQLGWTWPSRSGRTWQALLDIAERHYYARRPTVPR
jgi:hypothetical protein